MNLPAWIVDPNRNRINFHEPFELQYWLEEWKITPEQLREAKEHVGSSIVNEVYGQLKLTGLIQNNTPEDNNSFSKSTQSVQRTS